jgi:hypothetical protein
MGNLGCTGLHQEKVLMVHMIMHIFWVACQHILENGARCYLATTCVSHTLELRMCYPPKNVYTTTKIISLWFCQSLPLMDLIRLLL